MGQLHFEMIQFFLISSPTNPIILGFPWLQQYNPLMSWREKELAHWSPFCQVHCLTVHATSIVSPKVSIKTVMYREYHDLYEIFSKEFYHSTHLETPKPQSPLNCWSTQFQLWNSSSAISTSQESRENLPMCFFSMQVDPSSGQLRCGESGTPVHQGHLRWVVALAGGGTPPIPGVNCPPQPGVPVQCQMIKSTPGLVGPVFCALRLFALSGHGYISGRD